MGRMATADEIAAMVVYLASEEVRVVVVVVVVVVFYCCCFFVTHSLHLLPEQSSRLMVGGVYDKNIGYCDCTYNSCIIFASFARL